MMIKLLLLTLVSMTLMFSTGCTENEDPVVDLNKTTLIYLSNGNENIVSYTIAGESNNSDIFLYPQKSKLVYTQNRDNYIVSNTETGDPFSFEKDSAGFYGVCARITGSILSAGVIEDVASQNNRREVRLINLQSTNLIIAGRALEILDENGLVLARNTEALSIPGCSKAVLEIGSFDLSSVNTVVINGFSSHIPDYDPFIEGNLTKIHTVDVDLVYYRPGTYSLLPLAPYYLLK